MPRPPDNAQRIAAAQMSQRRRPIMRQIWRDLLFLHWPIQPSIIQQRLPEGLYVDTYQGQAYLGVVPFYMQGLRPVYCPSVPFISNFPELNLRTYVYDQFGRPGVWFFSLDAASWLSVKIARCFFALNYQYAKMRHVKSSDGWITHKAQRRGQVFQKFVYQPKGMAQPAVVGSFEYFLVERYHLFVQNNRGRLYLGTIQHAPYQLEQVDLKAYSTQLFDLNGFTATTASPHHLCCSRQAQVAVYALQPI